MRFIAPEGKNKNKKIWLLEYLEYAEEFERELERARYWREKANGLSAVKLEPTGVRGTGYRNPIDEFLIYSENAEECARTAERKRRDIEDAILSLKDTTERRVLRLRYLDFYSMAEISGIMHLSVSMIWKIHSKALEHLEIKE